MGRNAERLMDADEFLLWCLDQDEKYELVDGVPVLMVDGPTMTTGASRAHDRIVSNVIALLNIQLRGSPCWAGTADLAIRTRARMQRRADVVVTCDPVVRDKYDADDIKMIVEVLSPSDEGLAWQRKLEEYRGLVGLVYILLLGNTSPEAMLLTQDGKGWRDHSAAGHEASIELAEIGCRLPLAEIYNGIPFDAV